MSGFEIRSHRRRGHAGVRSSWAGSLGGTDAWRLAFTRAMPSAIVAIALVAGAVSAQQAGAQVTVSPSEARAFIPLDRTVGFVWQRPTVPVDVLEYEFRVTVESADGRHDFGFSLFRRNTAGEGRGDLAALLAAGQATAWRVTWEEGRQTATAVAAWPVAAFARPGGVEVVLQGEHAVAGVFQGLPRTVTVVRLIPDEPIWRATVPVAYRRPPGHRQELDSLVRRGATVRVRMAALGPGWHLGRFVRTRVVGPGAATSCPGVAPRTGNGMVSVALGMLDSLEVWAGEGTPDPDRAPGWQPASREALEQAGRDCRPS